MSTKWWALQDFPTQVFAVEKAERKCYTILDIEWESVGELVLTVILAVMLLFPACNLLTGLPTLGLSTVYACIGAVAEECFFRGFLFTALEKRGRYMAAILSSLPFALAHLVNLASYPMEYTLLQVGAAFSLGFALSGLLWKTKKLWPCLLCHLLINLTGSGALSPLGVGLTILCIFLYAGFGILLLRKKNEVLL